MIDVSTVTVVGAVIVNAGLYGSIYYKLGKLEQKINDHLGEESRYMKMCASIRKNENKVTNQRIGVHL